MFGFGTYSLSFLYEMGMRCDFVHQTRLSGTKRQCGVISYTKVGFKVRRAGGRAKELEWAGITADWEWPVVVGIAAMCKKTLTTHGRKIGRREGN